MRRRRSEQWNVGETFMTLWASPCLLIAKVDYAAIPANVVNKQP